MRRLVQSLSLLLFCLLLLKGDAWIGPFLSLDPIAGLAVPLAARESPIAVWPLLLLCIVTLGFGRIFCGYICPMGATLDTFGAPLRTHGGTTVPPAARSIKYFLLALILGSALLGTQLAFLASPLPLTARLYALVLAPLAELGLESAWPLAEQWYTGSWQPTPHVFATAWFVATFWALCLALERLAPRFWCRYLCPAGALLGGLARFAPWRRRVDNACTFCGRCAQTCPTGICGTPRQTSPSECLVCLACVRHCPHRAVRFALSTPTFAPATMSTGKNAGKNSGIVPSRRAFCGALTGSLLAGSLLGGALKTADAHPYVRPPGSRPEVSFLELCIRCGACLRVCPTGGLQALGAEAGITALFTPRLLPRTGPCRPECNACGTVCPTGALLALPPAEKRWAKIGTAVIDRSACLAWADNKRCMVCKENCPYGAVTVSVLKEQTAPVPYVQPERCYGCGYCEKYCPKEPSAITVTPQGAVRLDTGEYAARGKELHLQLDPPNDVPEHTPNPFPDGASDTEPNDTPPPGFLK